MSEGRFASANDAAEYYKNLAEEYKKKLDDSQYELEEFQDGSRDLEAELEVQLEQAEGRNRELSAANTQLKADCDRLQAKLGACECECRGLRDEVQKLECARDDLRTYVRKLEQKNDDFERATRASLMSLEDFETRLNQAVERNAFLEDEKENMAILIQRLKDESRDLKQELSVNETIRTVDVPQQPTQPPRDSNRLISERLRLNRNGANFMSNASSIVPHSALNILGDLLKKVGVLESKLQSCRESIKDTSENTGEKKISITLTSTSRVRHVNAPTVASNLKDFIPLTA